MKNHIIPLAMAAVLLTACEKQIDIDLTNQERIVVMHSFATNDKPLSVDVTLSRPVFGWHSDDETYANSPFPGVYDASATLSVKGSGTYNATRDSNRYSFAYTPQYGDEMTLHIEVPGKDPLSATTTMPFPPTIGTVEKVVQTNQYENTEYCFRIPISDRADMENYYSISLKYYYYYNVQQVDADGQPLVYDFVDSSSRQYFNCSDPLIIDHDMSDVFMDPTEMPEFWGSTLYFDDNRINGTTHTVEIKTYGRPLSTGTKCIFTWKLYITAHSREEYYFHTAMLPLNDIEDILNFFSEPATGYSNVEGGAGVFGAHTTAVYEFTERNW